MAIIKRFINKEIFEAVVGELRKVHQYLIKQTDDEIPRWNMQLRKDNKVNLYYKGITLTINLNARNKKDQFNLELSNTIKKIIDDENIFKVKPIGDLEKTVKAVMKKFEEYAGKINEVKGLKFQKERQCEQYIVAALENNKDFLVIDMEVVISGNPSEGDLLALVRNKESGYSFLPIELKMANQDCTTAIKQVNCFAEIIGKNITVFQENYLKVYEQKRSIGIITVNEAISISNKIDNVLVILLADTKELSSKEEKNKNELEKNVANENGEYAVEVLTTTLEEFVKLKRYKE